ncbi:hypothetical protein BHE74_00022422 [Ensete ventricosum]|nr:hypothetical protein GW17_00025457 [Ensete ventricosum]RWW69941.1 hypothetical protein BHE74_00022422 [Ensete ventricosum]
MLPSDLPPCAFGATRITGHWGGGLGGIRLRLEEEANGCAVVHDGVDRVRGRRWRGDGWIFYGGVGARSVYGGDPYSEVKHDTRTVQEPYLQSSAG